MDKENEYTQSVLRKTPLAQALDKSGTGILLRQYQGLYFYFSF
jgi:hypothetical protein